MDYDLNFSGHSGRNKRGETGKGSASRGEMELKSESLGIKLCKSSFLRNKKNSVRTKLLPGPIIPRGGGFLN